MVFKCCVCLDLNHYRWTSVTGLYYLNLLTVPFLWGTAVAQCLRCCATNRKVAGSIPAGVVGIKFFRSHYGPGVDSASNRHEYQKHFLEVKAAGA